MASEGRNSLLHLENFPEAEYVVLCVRNESFYLGVILSPRNANKLILILSSLLNLHCHLLAFAHLISSTSAAWTCVLFIPLVPSIMERETWGHMKERE